MMNIKHPKKDFNMRLYKAVLFTSVDYNILEYLDFFFKVDWIVENFKTKNQVLLFVLIKPLSFPRTKHSTNMMIQLIKYILSKLNAKYVLTRKFQTDNLEGGFGQYRQMAGSNYHISVQQILEAEKNLRLKVF